MLSVVPGPVAGDDRPVGSTSLIDELVRQDAQRMLAEARKTPKITEVLPLLYLHGLSSGDFVPALGQVLGSTKGLVRAGGHEAD